MQVGGPSRVRGAPAQPQAGWLQGGYPGQACEGRATPCHQMLVTEAPGMVLSSTADGEHEAAGLSCPLPGAGLLLRHSLDTGSQRRPSCTEVP